MSLMANEIREIPQAVARLLDDPLPIRAAADAARSLNPALIATVARGSSDHACTYLSYAAQLTLGLPVASIGPSVASIYTRQLRLPQALCLAISQSGQSPDIVSMTQMARAGGALTVMSALSKATSGTREALTNSASITFRVLVTTLIRVAPSITWLFVRM